MEGERIKMGVVGVDSGQLLITDPSNIDSEWKKEKFNDKKPRKNFSYNACCEKTLKGYGGQLNFKLGHPGAGVVFSSGFGDGVYDVIATIKDYGKFGKRITQVEIILIEDKQVERFIKVVKRQEGI